MNDFWTFSLTIGGCIFAVIVFLAGSVWLTLQGKKALKLLGYLLFCLTISLLIAMYVYAVIPHTH